MLTVGSTVIGCSGLERQPIERLELLGARPVRRRELPSDADCQLAEDRAGDSSCADASPGDAA